jgi:hypothetical protein
MACEAPWLAGWVMRAENLFSCFCVVVVVIEFTFLSDVACAS